MQALVLKQIGSIEKSSFELTTRPKPQPKSNEILVKVYASSLNPVDWKMAIRGFFSPQAPIVLGCDMAGVVEDVGSEVVHFKKGDRVSGFTALGQAGTFAQYCVIDEAFAFRIPSNISFEEASTCGCGGLTAALGLHKLGLPLPPSKLSSSESILVWGGASSVGMFVIQFAHLAGFNVIATASPKNFELLKKLGASHTFDYNSPEVIKQIREASGGKLKYAFDNIGSKTADACIAALDADASIATIAGKPTNPGTVRVVDVFLGGEISQYHEFLSNFIKDFSLLLESQVVPNPVHVLNGGLEAIPEGLSILYEGKVSGKKLVVVQR